MKFLLLQRRLLAVNRPKPAPCFLIHFHHRMQSTTSSNHQSSSSSSSSRKPSSYPGSQSKTTNTNVKSQRQKFKEIPVHPSIQRYIELIGVGIPSGRKSSKRLRQSLFQNASGLVDMSSRRSGRSRSLLRPPPPFSLAEAAEEEEGQIDGIHQDQNSHQRKNRRRITVIGKVASMDDAFPNNPKNRIPEVAICGRSNVGKSTLLNALLYGNYPQQTTADKNNIPVRQFTRGRTPEAVKLPKGTKAPTSSKPGETRALTFYQLTSGDTQLRLVDLPGYGFSFGPSDHDSFQEVLLKYLLERGKALKRVLLLVDGRHGLKKADLDFLETLQQEARLRGMLSSIPALQVILTKCDLVTRDDLARRVVMIKQQLSDVLQRETSALPVLLVSARAGVGYNNITRLRGATQQQQYRARGGILELQKELAALVPKP